VVVRYSTDRRGAELLFLVLAEREQKNSVAIASNEPFAGWGKPSLTHDPSTSRPWCAANVDRLTFGGNIIEPGTRVLPPGAQRPHLTRLAHHDRTVECHVY
jgi:hypothetical protein